MSLTALITALCAVPFGLLIADQIVYPGAYSTPILVVLLALLSAIILEVAIVSTIRARKGSRQAIAANENVLMSQALSRVIIPWRETRAWGVLSAAQARKQPAVYIIMGETRSIIWSEPEDAELDEAVRNGDRREAYRARAAQLHAMIAARTGLPLREIRLDDGIAPTM